MRRSTRAFRNTLDALPYLVAVHDQGRFEGGTTQDPRPQLARILVLCDVMMPGLNGVDVVEQVSARRPEALGRLVLMTGGSFTPRVERFLETARFPVLRKPFEASEVQAVLAEVTRA
jgi:CheY-like chemotaxis protein